MDNRILADPGSPDFELSKYPFYLLNRLVSQYNAVIEPRLRAIGLDIPYWRVLMILGTGSPRGVREIATAAVIPLSTMTRITQRMASAGLVALAPSPEDARVTLVSILKLGEEKLAQARKTTAPIYARIIRGVSADEFDCLIGMLDHLYLNLKDADATQS